MKSLHKNTSSTLPECIKSTQMPTIWERNARKVIPEKSIALLSPKGCGKRMLSVTDLKSYCYPIGEEYDFNIKHIME